MTCSGAAVAGRRGATTATVTVGSAPAIHPTTSSSSIMKEEWRRYGVSRRKQLVEKDEKDGGTSFDLHKKCPIQRYFQIADRVVSDFRSKCADPSTDIEETYVMGHRLLAFLGKALPQHPDYSKLAVAELCKQSAQDLDWIKLRMQEIALKIDEEQLNLYITMDFEPQLEDDSSVSSEEADTGFADFSKVDIKAVNWEDFSGWAFQDDAPSTTTETNLSSSSSKSQEANTSIDESEPKTDISEQPECYFDAGFSAVEGQKPKVEKACLDEEADEPHAYVKFHDDEDDNDDDDDDDEEEDDDDDDDHYRFVLSEEEGLAASILQTIAGEEVRYETDSEAVDSWAQDGESGTLSGASSGTALTYDPARIAFREIMNRLPQDKYTRNHTSSSPPSPPPPPPVPTNTPSTSEDERKMVEDETSNRDHWASFDFASARRQARLARLRNRTKETASAMTS